tara:strand:+ start:452 stop:1372 length:921 start_codon:yes stop_codon:yes gene_type:complete
LQNLDNILSLESLEFFSKNLVEGFITGKHKSPYHGFSVEFAEHRLYNKGESTKHVDWKLFGRTDNLFVKKYEEETNLRCQIIIDTSSSMFYPQIMTPTLSSPNKILYSIYSTAALINLFKKQRDSVGLSLFSDDLYFHSQNKGTNKHHVFLKKKMIEVLNSTPEFKTTSSIESIHKIASRLHKRSLVLLFTDMLDGVEDLSEIFLALQHLKFQKHEVILFHLSENKTEHELDFPNSPHKFIDIETKEEINLNPIEIKKEYKSKSENFLKELKIRCLQHKIDLVEVDVNKGIDQILISYLLKRQKMF